jgi:hypothetical protein
VIGIALLGGRSSEPGRQAVAEAVSGPTKGPTVAAERSIRLDQPARRGQVITTREIVIRGRVAETAGEVRIILESSSGKPIATLAIDPIGMPRNGMIPFESRFRLSTQRPAGSMVVSVVAVDPSGLPIDAVRRRFELGAVIDIPAPPRG